MRVFHAPVTLTLKVLPRGDRPGFKPSHPLPERSLGSPSNPSENTRTLAASGVLYNLPVDTPQHNFSERELRKFEAAAHRWWNPDGDFKPLHDVNPLRCNYIEARTTIAGKRLLDVGCGGGLLCEEMTRRGARVTGIDLGETAVGVARAHAKESGLDVDYRTRTPETLAAEEAGGYDVVTCLEMIEHVPDPASAVAACAALTKAGGDVVFSTINRNPKAYLFAIVGAEYVLHLLPKGTHDYAKLIKPSELAHAARGAGLELRDLTGLTYHPLSRTYELGRDVSVNYLAHFRKHP